MDFVWIGFDWSSIALDRVGYGLDWIGLEFFFGALDGSGPSKWVAGEAPGGLFGVLRDPKPGPG